MSTAAHNLATTRGMVDCFEFSRRDGRVVWDSPGIETLALDLDLQAMRLRSMTLNISAGSIVDWHHHECAEKITIVEGRLVLRVARSRRHSFFTEVVDLGTGSEHVVEPYQAHSGRYIEDTLVRIEFDPTIAYTVGPP